MLPVKQFTDFIEQNNLFNRDRKILAAVSGGMDSVLLTHLLKSAGFNFGIAHCNFQLRGDESSRDQEFCNNLANQFRVPLHITSFNALRYAAEHKISVQMAARDLRYQWFEQVCYEHGYTVIALAHHQNDAIETILLNLTRGTGIAGLHGISPKSGLLVRPMLFLNRIDIQSIVDNNNIPFAEDSSNTSAKYARNKIRLEVIPKSKALNPALEKTFESNLQHFRELEVLLQQKVAEIKKEFFVYHDDEIHISIASLKSLEPKRLLLYNLFQEYGFNETTVNDLIQSLNKHPGRAFETAGFLLVLDRDKLIVSKKGIKHPGALQININEHEFKHGEYKLTILHEDSPLIIKDNPLAVSIDSALLIYPLTMRQWEQGDYFYPIGMKTRKKLSDFFIDQKVPLHQKKQVPVLVNGNQEIIWLGGYRPDDRYKVTAKTKKVTIFELNKI